jgi:hypothetical protein
VTIKILTLSALLAISLAAVTTTAQAGGSRGGHGGSQAHRPPQFDPRVTTRPGDMGGVRAPIVVRDHRQPSWGSSAALLFGPTSLIIVRWT